MATKKGRRTSFSTLSAEYLRLEPKSSWHDWNPLALSVTTQAFPENPEKWQQWLRTFTSCKEGEKMCRFVEWNNNLCSQTQSECGEREREELQKSPESELIGVLKRCQACLNCSFWKENQKRGRSPMVTFRMFASACFDLSNSWWFKHALFEDSPNAKNGENNGGTLQRGAYS